METKETNSQWSRYLVEFVTAYHEPSDESRIVRAEYFRPLLENEVPLVILTHGMGDASAIPCKVLARTLVHKGIASIVLYLVFHSNRMSESMRVRMPALTSEEWFESYRQSVIEVRQVLDWIQSRPEINEDQVAVMGISLGGFISAISMGVDERIKAGVFVTMGGNSEIITWDSKSDKFRKNSSCVKAECHEIHSHYPEYLAEVAERGFENVAPLKQCFLSDAMTFAHRLRNRPVLMINALRDKYIPKEATLQFWEACGRPEIIWLPTGHASLWAMYPSISRKVTDFIRSSFSG